MKWVTIKIRRQLLGTVTEARLDCWFSHDQTKRCGLPLELVMHCLKSLWKGIYEFSRIYVHLSMDILFIITRSVNISIQGLRVYIPLYIPDRAVNYLAEQQLPYRHMQNNTGAQNTQLQENHQKAVYSLSISAWLSLNNGRKITQLYQIWL